MEAGTIVAGSNGQFHRRVVQVIRLQHRVKPIGGIPELRIIGRAVCKKRWDSVTSILHYVNHLISIINDNVCAVGVEQLWRRINRLGAAAGHDDIIRKFDIIVRLRRSEPGQEKQAAGKDMAHRGGLGKPYPEPGLGSSSTACQQEKGKQFSHKKGTFGAKQSNIQAGSIAKERKFYRPR